MEKYTFTGADPLDGLWAIENFFHGFLAGLQNWDRTEGTIEAHELISGRNGDQVVVYYSYQVGGSFYSGQFRKKVSPAFFRDDSEVDEVMERFPHGGQIPVLYSPSHPSWNVAHLEATDHLF